MKRWDIDLVNRPDKKPRRAFQVAYLIAIKEKEPEQFDNLISIIKEVEKAFEDEPNPKGRDE
ncbi:MAG: hypothetical protein ACXADO_00615 [Candidatus Thorarchaeota archaeon]